MDLKAELRKKEERRGERLSFWVRWGLIAFMAAMAAIQLLSKTASSRFSVAAFACVGITLAYNCLYALFLRGREGQAWISYLSVSVDIFLLSAIILITSLFQSAVGVASTAMVLIYPALIVMAGLRLKPGLVIYSTLLSLALFNAAYFIAYPLVDPQVFRLVPLIGPLGQVYKSFYIVISGLVLLTFPRTVDRLLSSQERSFIANQDRYRDLAGELDGRFAGLKRGSEELISSIAGISGAIERIGKRIEESASSLSAQESATEELRGLVKALREFSAELLANAESQAAEISDTASATEEMASNISSISANVDATRASTDALLSDFESGSEKLEAAMASVTAVAERSEGMLNAVGVIQSVASSTNLLAMNAAIEAAHAGDAGRGFSVVADEIRKLAESSAGQSREIAAALKEVKGKIDASFAQARSAGEAFSRIREGARLMSEHIAEIEAALVEQSKGSRRVQEAASTIRDSGLQVRDKASSLGARADELTRLADSLGESAKKVLSDESDIASSIRTIDESVGSVRALTAENGRNLSEAAAEVAGFSLIGAEEAPSMKGAAS